jgi:hypothetical protein
VTAPRWPDRITYVGLAFVLAALLVSVVSSSYHAGWKTGFRACEAIYQEAGR